MIKEEKSIWLFKFSVINAKAFQRIFLKVKTIIESGPFSHVGQMGYMQFYVNVFRDR